MQASHDIPVVNLFRCTVVDIETPMPPIRFYDDRGRPGVEADVEERSNVWEVRQRLKATESDILLQLFNPYYFNCLPCWP